MLALLKGTIVGLFITIVLYLIPPLSLIAPLVGGFAGAAAAKKGLTSGLAVGVLMTVAMLLPGLAIAHALNSFLSSVASSLVDSVEMIGEIEWIGNLAAGKAAGKTMAIWTALISHTAVLGLIGAIIGGAVAGRKA